MVAARRQLGAWEVGYALLTVLALGSAAVATVRIRTLEKSALWIDGQVRAQADDYQATLRPRFVDQEMQSFKERRQLMEAATEWWQIRLGVLMVWALCSFAFYILRTISGFAEEITDLPRPAATPIPRGSPASTAPLR